MTFKEKIYDLKNKKQEQLDKAKNLVLEDKLDSEEYKTAMAEADKLGSQIKALEDIAAQEDPAVNPGEDPTVKGLQGLAGQGAQR